MAGVTESANGARVVVRLGSEADAEAAAHLHAGSITEGFLSALGPRFLARLYRRVVRSPDAFLLVAEGGGGTAGFLAGAVDLRALYRRFLLHDGPAAVLGSLPTLLASWRHAWETLRHGSGPARAETATGGPAAELLSVAVDPAWRGRHVGAQLVDGFLAELERRGVGRSQVVVGADNAAAIALYRAKGFAPDHSFELHRGTVSLVMCRPPAGAHPVTARLVLAGAGAVAVALAATPLAAVTARRLGVVDHPGELKPQASAVPYLGGAAVFVAAVVGGAVGRPLLLLPLGLALALGVADDAVQIAPWARLGGQVAIGATAAAVVPTRLPGPVGPVLVVAVAVLLMNGVNMIDGLDALAGGVTAVAAGSFAWMLRGDGRELALALAGALLGFLAYNRPPARIYLGDGGAYLLGTALAVLLASAWAPGQRAPVGVAGLIVVAVPAAEVLFAVVRRVAQSAVPRAR